MRIKIVNWSKFNNPRKDVKSTTWFRFQNDYFTDSDFCDLPLDQKLVFPYLCSVSSSKMRDEFDVSERVACAVLGIPESAFLSCTKYLQSRGIIEIPTSRERIRVRNAARTYQNDTPSRNITGHNITNITEQNTSTTCRLQNPTPLDLAQSWNSLKHHKQTAINLSTMKPGSKRWLWAAGRLKDHPELAYWLEVIRRIAGSDFCAGHNDRAWVADFEFLVRQETHIKAMEGKYDNRDDADKYSQDILKLLKEQDEKDGYVAK